MSAISDNISFYTFFSDRIILLYLIDKDFHQILFEYMIKIVTMNE